MKEIMARESSGSPQGVATFEYNPADERFPRGRRVRLERATILYRFLALPSWAASPAQAREPLNPVGCWMSEINAFAPTSRSSSSNGAA